MKRIKLSLIALLCVVATHGQKMNVEVNSKAKAYNVDSIRIEAPVDKVYALIANISEWPTWMSGVKEMHLNGDVAEDKYFTWKAKSYKIKSRIHTVRPNQAIGWTGKMWWIKAVHNWGFESLPDGGTKVIVKENFQGFCSSMLKKSLKKDMRNDLLELKKEAEKRYSSSM